MNETFNLIYNIMKDITINRWLQLGIVAGVFITTLAVDWWGIVAFGIYFAVWSFDKTKNG